MRLDIESAGHEIVKIVFPSGQIVHYTDNLFMPYGDHCRKVWLCSDGAGIAQLQCNSAPAGSSGHWMVYVSDYFRNHRHSRSESAVQDFGQRFASASAGDTVMQLSTIADAANFSAGDRVFLHGRNKQNLGYPPNLDYHEHNTVDSVNLTTGEVTLTSPIVFDYDEDWHDIAQSFDLTSAWGKPRIKNLDNLADSTCYDHIRFERLQHNLSEHVDAPDLTAHYMTTQGALIGEQIDCIGIGQTGVSMNKSTTVRGGSQAFLADIDKLLGDVVLDNVTAGSAIAPATGANSVTLTNSVCEDHIRFASRNFTVDGLTINNGHSFGAVVLEPGSTNESGSIDNLVINYADIDVVNVVSAPTDRTITPNSTAANHIYVDVTASAVSNNLVNVIVGDIISDVDQVNWARVTDVTYDDINERFDITHNNSVTFSGDIVPWPSGSLNIGAITINHATKPKYEKMLWKQPHLQHQKVGQAVNFAGITDGQVSNRSTFKYVGIVDEITFTLTTAATSSDPNHLYILSMSDRGDSYAVANNRQVLFSGECQTDGATVTMNFSTGDITFSAGWSNTSNTPADLSAISNVATFLDLDVVKPASQGGGGLTYLDPLDCPEFDLEISGSAIA